MRDVTLVRCPECGCMQWYDIQELRETERIDFDSETGIEQTDSLRLHIDTADGWACKDNDHYADPETSELIEAARY
jgi:hypothetical protein